MGNDSLPYWCRNNIVQISPFPHNGIDTFLIDSAIFFADKNKWWSFLLFYKFRLGWLSYRLLSQRSKWNSSSLFQLHMLLLVLWHFRTVVTGNLSLPTRAFQCDRMRTLKQIIDVIDFLTRIFTLLFRKSYFFQFSFARFACFATSRDTVV